MISLAKPILGEQEKAALIEVIDSGWLTMGEKVKSFEQAFAKMHGIEEAVAVSSCTAGLHLSLAALGIGQGDEVLVPSLTFVATVNAVLYVGAIPVFVDISSVATPHMSIVDAEEKCTNRTKAVIVMHYGGYLVDLPSWRSFADQNQICLIEDAAHAPGMQGVGQVSDAAAFSFFSNKNMTTAEGGMVTSRNQDVLERIRGQRSHGMTTLTLERDKGHAYSYDVPMLGYNYRLDEIRAAVGLVQLTRLPEWNARRRELTSVYRHFLTEFCPEIIQPFDGNFATAAHLLPVLLPEKVNRERVMVRLRDEGIQSSNHYPPVHKFSYFQGRFPNVELKVTERYCAGELTLPLHPMLKETEVKYIAKVLSETLSGDSF